ncbi:MAG: YaiI/YqxD family protein [Clostridia bacterium]|nr:YaiI/YqxD family protein [Clostridia bacterium]
MKIIVDADACPVKNLIKEIAVKYSIPVTMVCDTSHILNDDYCRVITVDKFADSADIYLINLAEAGDVIITQDYGVAALAIGKKAYAISNNGMEYTDDNMDKLLFERFLGKKVRRAGQRTKGPGKRTEEDNRNFVDGFNKLLIKIGIDKA